MINIIRKQFHKLMVRLAREPKARVFKHPYTGELTCTHCEKSVTKEIKSK